MQCEKCGNDFPSKYYFKTEKVCIKCFNHLSAQEKKSARQPTGWDLMTSTTFELEGYRVKEQFGVVRGITVRSRSLFGTLGGSLQTIVGGNITLFTELCEKTRSEAFEMMIDHAEKIGANAVIGVRYDATEIMSGVTEVLCYGTAVIVVPA